MTEEELLQALRDASLNVPSNPEGYITAAEIHNMTGMSRNWISKFLRKLDEQGRLQTVMLTKLNTAKTVQKVPGYKLLSSDS